MPEMAFVVRWPDGSRQECYSPSLVMHDHLDTGASYPLSEFMTRSSTALTEASERVRAKFGFACTSAAATLEHLQNRAASFGPDDLVTVVSMEPPLPAPTPKEIP